MANLINSFWGVDSVVSDNLEMAFSFTKRVASATYACRIRRSSDNAETDIELESSGACDINSTVSAGGTLASWIGSNDGFMVTDYDQTGNGYDMTQSTTTKQAKIVNAGSWLGYKDYDGTDDIYYSSIDCHNTVGSVYVKADMVDTSTKYYLSQAHATTHTIFGLAADNTTSNLIRLMDFPGVSTPYSNRGHTTLPSAVNKLMYQSLGTGVGYKMRVNGTNQTITGTDRGWWFSPYISASHTLQKGGLVSNWGNLYSNYNEYEILVYSVAHSDSESATVEAAM